MTLLQAIILGIIQGATEFLPISSSGHLVLVPHLLRWEIPPDQAFAFNVMVQAATLIAVFSFFIQEVKTITQSTIEILKRRSFSDHKSNIGFYLLLATIPAGIMGLVFNGFLERVFGSPLATSIFLLGTALLLVIAEKAGRRDRSIDDVNWKDALWVGMVQILALFPGISRSGVTITGGMLRNLDRASSARLSFLMSIPLMVAAGLNGFYKFIALPNTTSSLPIFLSGSISAAIVGYISIKWLLEFLTHRSLYTFVIYCVIFALINITTVLIW